MTNAIELFIPDPHPESRVLSGFPIKTFGNDKKKEDVDPENFRVA